jgi:hypothetical protein
MTRTVPCFPNFAAILLSLSLPLTMIGCSEVRFSAKAALLSGTAVFENVGQGGNGEDGLADNEVPVDYMCSNDISSRVGYNLLASKAVELRVVDANGEVVCKRSAGVREALLNKNALPISLCAGLKDEAYALSLVDPNRGGSLQNDLLHFKGQNPTIRRESSGRYHLDAASGGGLRFVLYDVNVPGNYGNGEDPCDTRASPLIINTAPEFEARAVSLTAPLNGVFFDILGERSFPVAHAPKRISWLRDPDYMYLALPDGFGQVHGINELFGDSTLGPDGAFAANGYLALAKYDDNRDGVIDERDAVFARLRLWSDRNFNGVADPGELIPMSAKGLAAIDLAYDAGFAERDVYGNETKLKSAVRHVDGSLRLIFDLWFRYL